MTWVATFMREKEGGGGEEEMKFGFSSQGLNQLRLKGVDGF